MMVMQITARGDLQTCGPSPLQKTRLCPCPMTCEWWDAPSFDATKTRCTCAISSPAPPRNSDIYSTTLTSSLFPRSSWPSSGSRRSMSLSDSKITAAHHIELAPSFIMSLCSGFTSSRYLRCLVASCGTREFSSIALILVCSRQSWRRCSLNWVLRFGLTLVEVREIISSSPSQDPVTCQIWFTIGTRACKHSTPT